MNQNERERRRSKYRLLGLVGQGQFGRVFCAAHRHTGHLVALKDLDRQRFPTVQFLRELRFLLSLQHPNIVLFQAVEQTETGRYLVMDYCEGGTLRSVMREEGGLSLSQSVKLVMDVLAGLDHAHAQQIIHCDIKPENILLNVTPTGWTARISDFGIARLMQEVDAQRLSNTGSPAYMAPERFYGQYSTRSDLYSAGVLLYELIVGHRPFSGTPAELMDAHLNHPVIFPETVPEQWQPILSTALQKLSARRFRSAQEMRDAILKTAQADQIMADQMTDEAKPLPLLKPMTLPCSTTFCAQHREKLRFPKTALYALSNQSQTYLFRGGGEKISVQSWTKQERSTTYSPHSPVRDVASLSSPLTELVPRPQGCFIVTQTTLHFLGADGLGLSPVLQLVKELPPASRVAIEVRGRWFASLTPNGTGQLQLEFERLPQISARMTIAAEPVQLSLPAQSISDARIFAIDAHHVAVFCDREHFQNDRNRRGTEVLIFCRRGQQTGSLTLPLRLGQTLMTAKPYRLLAVDRDNPNVVAIIDLKPYRILRIGVDTTPVFLAEAPWGFLLADLQGKIVLLDTQGQKVGCLVVPEPITAIATLGQHQFTIATWSGLQGSLYTVDLKEVDVDLIF